MDHGGVIAHHSAVLFVCAVTYQGRENSRAGSLLRKFGSAVSRRVCSPAKPHFRNFCGKPELPSSIALVDERQAARSSVRSACEHVGKRICRSLCSKEGCGEPFRSAFSQTFSLSPTRQSLAVAGHCDESCDFLQQIRHCNACSFSGPVMAAARGCIVSRWMRKRETINAGRVVRRCGSRGALKSPGQGLCCLGGRRRLARKQD